MRAGAVLCMEDICFQYGSGERNVLALDSVSLEIRAGEFVAISGPSGSGKSTLMQVMGCMLTPTSGSYFLLDEEVSSLEKNRLAEIRNKHIGFVFQNFNLLSRASALYNVALPLIFSGVKKQEREERALSALTRVGLAKRASHFPSELSGGEQQRVAIARAIIGRPSLLLADEPTGNLDQQTGRAIMDIFQGMIEEGMTVVYVTHDPDLQKMASHTLHLVDAQLVD